MTDEIGVSGGEAETAAAADALARDLVWHLLKTGRWTASVYNGRAHMRLKRVPGPTLSDENGSQSQHSGNKGAPPTKSGPKKSNK